MAHAVINNSELTSGVTTFTADDRQQLLGIFQSSLENAINSKYSDYQLKFYFEGKQIDVLNIQFVFSGKPNQTEMTSFQVHVGENLCSDRDSSTFIVFYKLIVAQGKECEVKFSFSGGNSQEAKMIDQNVVLAFSTVAKKFFDAEKDKSAGILNSALNFLRLT
ncbi:MAG: hypothetical protein ChlgKO_11290 [Chlamydiales bacterium]